LLPEPLLNYRVHDTDVVPVFLGENDLPALRMLLDEVARFDGHRESELSDRLRASIAPGFEVKKQRLAAAVLNRTLTRTHDRSLHPKTAREALFGASAQGHGSRDEILASASKALGVTNDALEAALFADLPGERFIRVPGDLPGPLELALRSNLILAQGLLARACTVSIALEGNARAIVRQARLRRLICGVRPRSESNDAVTLDVSGPYALFKHTLVYGRALGELVPLLAWCRRFRLEASCVLRERQLVLRLASGDPIFPGAEPRRFDSKLEARFARELARLSIDWEIIREPEPVPAGPWLIFPDFCIAHRSDANRRWFVEIVGYWTDRYLERKLASYREAGIKNLILCIDQDLATQGANIPSGARIVRFRRTVDARAVLAILDEHVAVPALAENTARDST